MPASPANFSSTARIASVTPSPDAEGPAAPAAEPEPSSQKIKSHTPDLEAVDLQRLLTDARYQLDIMDIYGQEQTQRLLDQARSK